MKIGDIISVKKGQSKYNGRVSGLPSGSIYENASERAFFILMIGEKKDVLKFKDNLETNGYPNVSEGNKSFTIYNNDFVLIKLGPREIKKEQRFQNSGD